MIVDCRGWDDLPEEESAARLRRVFLDGVEISQVWYADTDLGFVRSYDVLGDGKAHATCEQIDPDVLWEAMAGRPDLWDMPEDGVMSKTIFGTVELRPFE